MRKSRQERHEANLSLVREGIVRWNLQHHMNVPDGRGLADYLIGLLDQEGRLK